MKSKTIALLVLSLTCLSLTVATCPYNVTECECRDNILICTNLQEMPELITGKNATLIDIVTFQGGNLTKIPNHSLPPGLITIEFVDLSLTEISDGAFTDSANTLNNIAFQGGKLNMLSTAFRNLSKLNYLAIYDCYIEQWDNATLQTLGKTLIELDLDNVGLSEWPSWLSFFQQLISLTVANNSISVIPDDAFDAFKAALQVLSLETFGLTQLPKALSTLPTVTSLNLKGNKLADVNGRPGVEQLTLFPLRNTLQTLNTESSELTVIPDFTKFTLLTTVNLGSNQYLDVNTGLFPPSVTKLILQNNNLLSVPPFVSNVSKLFNLDLSNNEITDFNSTMFPPNLSILYLKNNNITSITDTFFANFSSLTKLHLEFNPTTTISPAAFESLKSLTELYLDGTNLTEIPIAVTALTKLQKLSMSKIASVSCPCPPPEGLVQWYVSSKAKVKLSVIGSCNMNKDIDYYLRVMCVVQPVTTQGAVDTTHGNAPAISYNVCSRYFCLLLMFLIYYFRF